MQRRRDWAKIILSGKNHLFSMSITSEQIVFYLTDMVQLYSEKLTKQEFSSKMAESNPDLEDFDTKEMCAEIGESVSKINTPETPAEFVLRKVNISENRIEIGLAWENGGIPLTWNLNLSLDSAEELFNVFTSQAVSLIDLLLEQRAHLLEVIQKKDLEVEEYRLNNVKIRPHIRTERFQPKDFFNKTADKCSRPAMDVLCSPDTVALLAKIKLSPDEASTDEPEPVGESKPVDTVDSLLKSKPREPIKRKTEPPPKIIVPSKKNKLNNKLRKL